MKNKSLGLGLAALTGLVVLGKKGYDHYKSKKVNLDDSADEVDEHDKVDIESFFSDDEHLGNAVEEAATEKSFNDFVSNVNSISKKSSLEIVKGGHEELNIVVELNCSKDAVIKKNDTDKFDFKPSDFDI